MNLVQERIAHWCGRLKLMRVATEWPGLAEEALKEEKSLGEFLEQILATECGARDRRSRDGKCRSRRARRGRRGDGNGIARARRCE